MKTLIQYTSILSIICSTVSFASPEAPPRSESANTSALYDLSPKGEQGQKRQPYLKKADALGKAADNAEAQYKRAARICMGAGNMSTGSCTDIINVALAAQKSFEEKLAKLGNEEAAWARIEARAAQRTEKTALVKKLGGAKPLPPLPTKNR